MNDSINHFSELVFVDVETTGLLYQPESRIVEISSSVWNHSGHCERNTSLINPLEPIPEIYTQIHGINDDMVRDAPTFLEYWRDREDLFKGRTVIAHNLSFDMGMINKELARLEKPPLGNAGIDTVPILRKLLPDQKNHKLQNLAESLGVIHTRKHRAEDDVLALEQILSIAMGFSVEILTGQIGIDLSLWGGISSHRYFKDVIFWAQRNDSEVKIVLVKRDTQNAGEPFHLESVKVEKPAFTAKHLGEYREKGKYPISWSEVYRIEHQ